MKTVETSGGCGELVIGHRPSVIADHPLRSAMLCLLAAGMMMAGTAYAWSPALLASGGDTNYIWFVGPTEAYGVHVWTNTSGGTFTPLAPPLQVQYLVVAGGGGGGGANVSGGGNCGGGGGAGGLLTNSPASLLTISSAQTITVGAGGSGRSMPGGPSSIGGLVGTTGGGCGTGLDDSSKKDGGSGGGACAWVVTAGTGIAVPVRQGYDGGAQGGNSFAGGGGGAGGIGGYGASPNAGNGGAGVVSSITGTNTAYAAGGGGAGNGTGGSVVIDGSPVVIGGNGGTGSGGAGLDGTGSGGGGTSQGDSGKGGSGIVVIRYQIPYSEAPVIVNQPVTSVTTNSATFNGILDDTNTSATTVCVLWGPQNGGLAWSGWANTNWFVGNGWTNDTSFSTNITGLTPDITYYYTYAAVNGSSNAVAPGVKTFITGAVTVNATDSAAQYKAPPVDTGAYTIYRPVTATNEAVTVNYALSGSMTNGVHYTLSGSATIGAGATSTVFTLTPTYAGSGGNAVLTLTTGALNTYPVGVSPNDQTTVTLSAPALPPSVLVVTNGTPGVVSTEPYGTWATAATNIQTAVNFAAAVFATHPTFNTVTVSNGTYTIGTQITISTGITVRSFGNGVYGGLGNASNTIVQASGTIRVFEITHTGAVLEGLTIQKGLAWANWAHGLGVNMNGGLVRDCFIQDNNQQTSWNWISGGGMYVTGGGTVSNCVIRRNWNNIANAYGGGVYVNNGLITHCQILNNTNNEVGAGVYMTGSTTVLRNCLIAANTVIGATAQGGGVYLDNGVVESCTIVTNKTVSGDGGIYRAAGTVSNSIVYFNTVGGVHSNLNTTSGFYYSCATNPALSGSGNISADPLFTSLAGGDYTLQKSSPCVDNGAYQSWMTGAKDLAGNARILRGTSGLIVDMGAYETDVPPKGTIFLMR